MKKKTKESLGLVIIGLFVKKINKKLAFQSIILKVLLNLMIILEILNKNRIF
jgi:hypothetical protein